MWARNVEKVLARIMSAMTYQCHGESSVEKRSAFADAMDPVM